MLDSQSGMPEVGVTAMNSMAKQSSLAVTFVLMSINS